MTILVNGKEIESFIFPGGECHVRLNSIRIGLHAKIYTGLDNSDDVMKLLLTVDAIRHVMPITNIKLVISYLPYARQDRVCSSGEAFSLKVMSDLINSLNCDSVIILDPHSEVVDKLIDNYVCINASDLIERTKVEDLIIENNLMLISPDEGSTERVNEIRATLECNSCLSGSFDVVYGSKKRDPLSGKISEFKISGNVKYRDVIMIDDICDGGGTFIGLSKVLKEKGANKIYLYVTHGIFSKGLDELLNYIEHIYCYHLVGNYINPLDDRLTIIGDKNDY